jgi:cobaltochelatase CobN
VREVLQALVERSRPAWTPAAPPKSRPAGGPGRALRARRAQRRAEPWAPGRAAHRAQLLYRRRAQPAHHHAWRLGFASANLILERHLQDHGDHLRQLGLSVWGTATMRTGGDDIAQAMALMGVRPVWATGSQRVDDFEILPLSLLDRPRVDVTLRVSGFFRDAFANLIRLFDAAVQAVAALDEPDDLNPLAARVRAERQALLDDGLDEAAARQAGWRVFGAKPGAYGAGVQNAIDGRLWHSRDDLAEVYLNHGGYAYGASDEGTPARARFAQRLSQVQAVLQNQDNREHDLLDSNDYYQFQGGMLAAAETLAGTSRASYHGDHSQPTGRASVP